MSNHCSINFIKARASKPNLHKPQTGGFRQSAARLGEKNEYIACSYISEVKKKISSSTGTVGSRSLLSIKYFINFSNGTWIFIWDENTPLYSLFWLTHHINPPLQEFSEGIEIIIRNVKERTVRSYSVEELNWTRQHVTQRKRFELKMVD